MTASTPTSTSSVSPSQSAPSGGGLGFLNVANVEGMQFGTTSSAYDSVVSALTAHASTIQGDLAVVNGEMVIDAADSEVWLLLPLMGAATQCTSTNQFPCANAIPELVPPCVPQVTCTNAHDYGQPPLDITDLQGEVAAVVGQFGGDTTGPPLPR